MSQTPSQELQDSQRKEREHFFGSAKVIAAMTVLSRIAGMVRAMAIATLGASAWTDAFALAFKIPNLFRRLFAEGALSAVFVPVMTETLEEGPEGHAKASRLLANAMGILAMVLLGLMLLGQAIVLVWALWPRLTGVAIPPDTQLMLLLTSIMLPFMFTICLLALASAALNCRGHFWYPAATPIILNVVIIAAAYWVAPFWKQNVSQQLVVVAASVTVAGVVQFAGVFWLLKRTGFSLRWRLRPVEPGIGPMIRRMAPMLMGLGFLQLSELFQSVLAWWLRYEPSDPTISLWGLTLVKPLLPGVLPRIDNARYLYQFPMGVLAISLGVAVFPLLSRYAARGDLPNLRDSINRALRLSFMEGMATGVGLYILAEPISWLLFRHGKYTAADVGVTAFIVQMYVVGMWSYCTYQIVVRAFYALKDVKTPLVVSCVLAVVNLLMVCTMIFIPGLGAGAFGLSTALTFAINTIVLALLLRRRLGLLGGRKMAISFARSIAACLVMAAVLFWMLAEMTGREQTVIPGLLNIGPLLRSSLGLGHCSNLVIVGLTIPVGAFVFIASAWAMRSPELAELLGPIAERLRKKKTM
jgi:putative peptidoglycan lipid II flippase